MTSRPDIDGERGRRQESRVIRLFGVSAGPFLRRLIGVALLLAVVYQEEDWRGRRAWQACKRGLESKGMPVQWQAFVPPAVPDDLNAFKAPKMPQWFLGRGPGDLGARLMSDAVFDSAKQRLPALAEITFLPLVENESSKDTNLTFEYRAPILALDSGTESAGARGPAKGVIRLNVEPSTRAQICRMVEACAILETNSPSFRIMKAASGRFTLFWDVGCDAGGGKSGYPGAAKTAHIVMQAKEVPSVPEVEEFLRDRDRIRTTQPCRLRVLPYGTNGFRVFASPPAFCRADDYLACTEQFEEDFDLMREALKRPFARPDGDYGQPAGLPVLNFVAMRTVVQTLADRAQASLLLKQPERALRDLVLTHDLCTLCENKPSGRPLTLVGAMIEVAITGLYGNTIAEGFGLEAWREPELRVLEAMLGEVRLMPLLAGAFAAERAASCHTLESMSALQFARLLSNGRIGSSLWDKLKDPAWRFMTFAPRGWIYENMTTVVTMRQQMLEGYDTATETVRPQIFESASTQVDKRLGRVCPSAYLAQIMVPNAVRAWKAAACNQTLVNQGYIACALERYRLIHGAYPADLNALVPEFANSIPHDIISGKLPHYRRTANGQFLLYCEGWDESGDGGDVPKKNDASSGPSQSGWVWPQFARVEAGQAR